MKPPLTRLALACVLLTRASAAFAGPPDPAKYYIFSGDAAKAACPNGVVVAYRDKVDAALASKGPVWNPNPAANPPIPLYCLTLKENDDIDVEMPISKDKLRLDAVHSFDKGTVLTLHGAGNPLAIAADKKAANSVADLRGPKAPAHPNPP